MQSKNCGSSSFSFRFNMKNYIPLFLLCQYINKNFFVFLFFSEVAADIFCIIFILFSERFAKKRFFDLSRYERKFLE